MLGQVHGFELSIFKVHSQGVSTLVAIAAHLSTFAILIVLAANCVADRAWGQQPSFAESSEILLVTDTGLDTRWIELPRLPRVALLDEYAPLAPAAPTTSPPLADPSNSPAIVPPQNGTTGEAAAGGLDLPMAESDVVDDVLCEEKKEEEEKKPVIADLAKGILIQSNDGDLTFVPGMRIQPRYNYDANFNENDFFINRFRLKGSGSAYGIARYYVELQLDGTSRFQTTPLAQDQNAWLDFVFEEDLVYFRVGLFDVPFSRDAMTSDSRLLIMDRSLIRGELAGLGLADDTVGFLFHGRPYDGHLEYAFGLLDDFAFEKRDPVFPRETDQLMPAFRLGAALLDPYPARDGYADYWGSYLGQSTRLDIGVNAAHLGEVFDGPLILDLTGVGGDLFAASGHYTFQTEFDWFVENVAFFDDFSGHGWYVQGGYLFNPADPCLEFALRYQELDSDLLPDKLKWTSVGFNWYIRDHNMKVQTDYTFRDGDPLKENVYALQFQLDF